MRCLEFKAQSIYSEGGFLTTHTHSSIKKQRVVNPHQANAPLSKLLSGDNRAFSFKYFELIFVFILRAFSLVGRSV